MVLVERKQQSAIFGTALDSARLGFGGSITITGPIASGKTTLLRVFTIRAAQQGYLVLSGAGIRAERQLPLGLVNHICHDFPLQSYHPAHSEPIAASMPTAAALIREVQTTAAFSASEQGDSRRFALTAHATFAALQKLSECTPVLLVIDDLHHVDPLSLRCLLYVARRIGHLRLVMVLCGSELGEPTDPLLYRELLDQSPWDRIRVPALTLDEVTELLRMRHSDLPPEVCQAFHAATGGNPMLVQALAADLEERGIRGSVDEDGLIATGGDYALSVTRCLDHCDTETQQVLRATAVLDKELPSGLVPLARLAALDTAVVARRASELEMSGLLRKGRVPHPSVRQAVVDSMPPAVLGDLHLNAARLLHEDGAAPLVIANHLLASGLAIDAWAVPILRAAAEGLLDDGDSADYALAVGFLGLANNAILNEADRAAIRAALLRAEWRINPQQAQHRLTQLSTMASNGLLSVPDLLLTAGIQLWLGQQREAVAILDQLDTLDTLDAVGSDRAEIRFNRVWTAFAHPGAVDRRRAGAGEHPVALPTSTFELLADHLETVLSKGADKQAVTAAEQALQRCRLGDRTLAPITASLAILIYADQLETATLWCDRLLTQAIAREAPTWQAILSTIRADISLQQGHLLDAQCCAETALAQISLESWATAIGGPVSIALMAMTARGKLDEAAQLLEYPVPDGIFQTRSGLRYLQARGRFYLATNRPEAALRDFLTCGELMDRWNMDQPALVPWRLEAARAHLDLQQPKQARCLIEAQLSQLTGEPTRTKGIVLRLLAATSDLGRRAALLRESAEILRQVGNSLELAYTLADLSQAYRALGDSHRARITVRRAWRLAADCRADALRQVLLPDLSEEIEASEAPSGVNTRALLMSLSNAERRVAALAAQGSTNRQIANKLFVTVSTVEQHLTRVYRKLEVTSRNDLLAKLPGNVSSIA